MLYRRVLIVFSILLAIFQIISALVVLQLPDTITSHQTLPVWLHVGLSVGWAVGFGFSGVYLYRHRLYAVRYANWLMVAFIGYSWLRVVIFAQADYDRGRLPCFSVLILLGLVLLLWRMGRERQQRHSSGENYSNDQ